MVPYLYTPREHHNVRTAQEYRAVHQAFIANRRFLGSRATVHDSPIPMVARVDASTWLIDCECGAGNATDPDWGVACCFGCGAIHETIAFPDLETADLIETVLLARLNPMIRYWQGETIAALAAKNLDLNAPVPDAVVEALAADAVAVEEQP